jgi:hypothetical protein
MLKVINIKNPNLLNIHKKYIGRKSFFEKESLPNSILANPFKIGEQGDRDQVVYRFKKYLWKNMKLGIAGKPNKIWEELLNIKRTTQHLEIEGLDFHLVCWCSPLSCHGDAIKAAVEWMIKEGY